MAAGGGVGIKRGDLITAIDGVPTTSSSGLALLLDDLAGGHATFTLLRGNNQATAEIELAPAQ